MGNRRNCMTTEKPHRFRAYHPADQLCRVKAYFGCHAASGLRARRRRFRARSSPLSPPQIPCVIEFPSA